MEYESLLKKHRKKPILPLENLPRNLDLGNEDIKRLIPHREPLLFLDRITGISLEEELITGMRYMRKEDPVFKGHFPDYPVYPGSFQIEMIGQLGLCLTYFISKNTEVLEDDARPVAVRATRVIGAVFMEPLLPDKEVLLIAKSLDRDGFFARMIGQAIVDGKITCVTIGEVYFPDLSA